MKPSVKINFMLPLFLFICALGALLLWPGNVRAEEVNIGAFKLTTEGVQGTDYSYDEQEKVLTILTNTPITIANKASGATKDRIVVAESVKGGAITLDGVDIEFDSKDSNDNYHCAFSLEGSARVSLTLADNSDNTLTSGFGCAGIQAPRGTTLTLSGSGSLKATGGSKGAGIGGGDGRAGGEISITGGIVTAKSGGSGAGIGGGDGGAGGDTSITGGIVTAEGVVSGAGIGSGWNGHSGGNISITGGVVMATGGADGGAGIGGGYYGAGGDISITGGSVTAKGGDAGLTGGNGAGIGGGSVKATGGGNGAQDIGHGDNVTDPGTLTTTRGGQPVDLDRDVVTLDGKAAGIANRTVTGLTAGVNTGVNRTENLAADEYGIHDMKTDADGKVYLYLTEADNELVSQRASLKLDGLDPLYTGLFDAARTAALNDQIDNPGTIDLSKDLQPGNNLYIWNDSYGIGADKDKAQTNRFPYSGDYTLSGGTKDQPIQNSVTVMADYQGMNAKGETLKTITLNGLNIKFSADPKDTDHCAFSLERKIEAGASVSLTLAENSDNTLTSGWNCAGLQAPEGTALTIGGSGSLNATGGFDGAGIGGGSNRFGGDISITGGIVKAESRTTGAGIGGGLEGAGGTISITGGIVTATGGNADSDGGSGAGIGGGKKQAGGDISITGGIVVATGGAGGGAGIGSGFEYIESAGTIAIAGGSVTATGVNGGAGIGGGLEGFGGTVTIDGGSVKAIGGGSDAQDIGHGAIVEDRHSGTLKNTAGSDVYRVTVQLAGVSAEIPVFKADEPKPENYGLEDVQTDDAGKLYFYLPANDPEHLETWTTVSVRKANPDGDLATGDLWMENNHNNTLEAGKDDTGLRYSDAQFTYNGKAQAPALMRGDKPAKADRVFYKSSQTNWGADNQNINAGSGHRIVSQINADKTSETGQKIIGTEYNIEQANTTVTDLPTASLLTYGQKLSDSKLEGGKAKDAGGKDLPGTFTWAEPEIKPSVSDSDKTKYTVIFTPEDKNYRTVDDNKITVKVDKADSTLDVKVSQDTITYGDSFSLTAVPAINNTLTKAAEDTVDFYLGDPTANQLLASAKVANGKAFAEINKDNGHYPDAGTVTITAVYGGSGSLKGATGTAQLTVNPAAGRGSVSLKGWTYGETANSPVPQSDTNGTDNVSYQYKEQGAADSTYKADQPTLPGDYTVKATFAATTNYKEVIATADFKISGKKLEGLSLSDDTCTYDGAPHSLAVKGEIPPECTVTYEPENATDAGDYPTTATISGQGYETLELTATLHISKATPTMTLTAEPEKEIKVGEPVELTVEVKGVKGEPLTGSVELLGQTLTLENGQATAEYKPENTNPTKITADYTSDDANYKDAQASITLTANKKVREDIIIKDATKIFGDLPFKLSPTGGSLQDGETYTYESNDTTVAEVDAEGIVTLKTAGSAQITVSVDESDAWNKAEATMTLTVNKGDIAGITFESQKLTANGKPQSIEISGSPLPDGASVSYTGNGKTESGVYPVTANIDGGQNYNNLTLNATMTIVNPYAPVKPTTPDEVADAIDQLPTAEEYDKMTDEEKEVVKEAVDTVVDGITEMTPEEQAKIPEDKIEKLGDLYDKVYNVVILKDTSAAENLKTHVKEEDIKVYGAGMAAKSKGKDVKITIIQDRPTGGEAMAFSLKLFIKEGDDYTPVELSTPIVIEFPLPESVKAEGLEIHHLNPDGSLKEILYPKFNGRELTFMTTSFSNFLFVETGKPTPTPVPTPGPSPTPTPKQKVTNPLTGKTLTMETAMGTGAVILSVTALIALGGWQLFRKRSK